MVAKAVGSRFMSTSPADEFRRYQRVYQRTRRSANDAAAREVDSRPGSRHRLYPCCRLRRAQCKCDWNGIEKAVVKKSWQSFQSSIAGGTLLKLADTQDCGPGMRELQAVVRLDQLWALCMMYRYFSHAPTWAALVAGGAVKITPSRPHESPVHEAAAALVLTGLWGLSTRTSQSQVFGTGRRALPLRSFRGSRGKWLSFKVATNAQKGRRDAKALAMFWAHRPRKLLLKLGATPSCQGFVDLKVAYANFQQNVATGLGPYFLKCVLDMFLPLSRLPEWIVGTEWPVDCPGYKSAMHVLAPGLTKVDAGRFLLYVHRSRALAVFASLSVVCVVLMSTFLKAIAAPCT